MNRYAKIVLWLGLIMIVAGLVKDWPEIRAVLFTGGSAGVGPQNPRPPGPGHKCPAGWLYDKTSNMCVPPIQPGPPVPA